jgi:tetratricopeptide (TPR) repeat protein
VGVKTYYAAENWFASVSSTTYLFLYENDYIQDADVNGVTVLKMPDGSTVKAGSFVIRNLRIGNIIVQNLPAFVLTKQNVPLIVGNSAFDCFGEVVQDGNRLLVYDGTVLEEETQEPELEPSDELKMAAQTYLDAKDYQAAAGCFESLQKMGELNMYNEYQYAMVLNILGRSDECIALCDKWIANNLGRAMVLDYWMYDALGDCYARKRETLKSIENYEKAVATYCKLFNTSEKEIKKSKFQDETLSYTLYDLGRQYASVNIGKTEYYMALSAKSGNRAAQDFCKSVHIKY